MPKTAVEAGIATDPAFTSKGSVDAEDTSFSGFGKFPVLVNLYRLAVEGDGYMRPYVRRKLPVVLVHLHLPGNIDTKSAPAISLY